MPQHPAPHHPQGGFTLVELAIVMTIVGILIGGVLKGEELVNNARMKRVIKDFQSISAAHRAFNDQYSMYPGDMATAVARLPGCTAASFCQNGNSDGRVGKFQFAASPASNIYLNRLTTNQAWFDADGQQYETLQYWKHLAIADMIIGIVPNADPADPDYGVSHPRAPFGGGYSVLYVQNTYTSAGSAGHWIRLEAARLRGDTTVMIGSGRGAGISPKYASMIDDKIDDGDSNGGIVRGYAWAAEDGCGKFDRDPAWRYNPNVEKTQCLLYYFIN